MATWQKNNWETKFSKHNEERVSLCSLKPRTRDHALSRRQTTTEPPRCPTLKKKRILFIYLRKRQRMRWRARERNLNGVMFSFVFFSRQERKHSKGFSGLRNFWQALGPTQRPAGHPARIGLEVGQPVGLYRLIVFFHRKVYATRFLWPELETDPSWTVSWTPAGPKGREMKKK